MWRWTWGWRSSGGRGGSSVFGLKHVGSRNLLPTARPSPSVPLGPRWSQVVRQRTRRRRTRTSQVDRRRTRESSTSPVGTVPRVRARPWARSVLLVSGVDVLRQVLRRAPGAVLWTPPPRSQVTGPSESELRQRDRALELLLRRQRRRFHLPPLATRHGRDPR